MRLTLNNDEVQELMQIVSDANSPLLQKIDKQYQESINKDIAKKTALNEERARRETLKHLYDVCELVDDTYTNVAFGVQ